MSLSAVIEDIREDPHRRREFYEYPELYDFYHSRILDRDTQVELLERFQPPGTSRVLEFGCGTGPLLARIEDDYATVLGVDADERMLDAARERVTGADVRRADFTEWSAADEGRVFDAAALMGGMLHLTDDRDVEAFAENVHGSLREGGAFVTFFQPLSDGVRNGSRDVRSVESERYLVERHATSALTSAEGHYTTTYLFVIRDKPREREARMGTVFRGRFHDPDTLEAAFGAAGFDDVRIDEADDPATLCAVR